jgi:hypothetical protein
LIKRVAQGGTSIQIIGDCGLEIRTSQCWMTIICKVFCKVVPYRGTCPGIVSTNKIATVKDSQSSVFRVGANDRVLGLHGALKQRRQF